MAELEAVIEKRLIEQLCTGESQWTYRPDIRTEEQLWDNFKYILEQNNKAKLNDEPLSDSEFAKIKNDLSHASFYDAAKWLVGENGKVYVHVQRGNDVLHLLVMNNEHVAGGTSVYEVINQYQAYDIICSHGMLQLIGLLTCEQLQKTEIILYWRYRMNTEKTFADRLKELRNIRNYTQEELGKITNISVQSIRRYEQGRLNEEPSAYNLLQLAKALDVTPEYLLIGDNNMTSYTEAIKRELKQLNDYGQISEIKETELNSTILSHLEMSNDLVDAVKTDWNAKGIFKRIEKEEDKQIVVDSYCTRPYVQDVILRYCQNRSIFKTKFAIIDGMLLE